MALCQSNYAHGGGATGNGGAGGQGGLGGSDGSSNFGYGGGVSAFSYAVGGKDEQTGNLPPFIYKNVADVNPDVDGKLITI